MPLKVIWKILFISGDHTGAAQKHNPRIRADEGRGQYRYQHYDIQRPFAADTDGAGKVGQRGAEKAGQYRGAGGHLQAVPDGVGVVLFAEKFLECLQRKSSGIEIIHAVQKNTADGINKENGKEQKAGQRDPCPAGKRLFFHSFTTSFMTETSVSASKALTTSARKETNTCAPGLTTGS